ncbi:hypothetical protein IL45_12235 [Nonlabens ulvanivorans]|uniref:Uncharacterized protein n=2 Tax=Nonlabens ulvanivorans TaxID=906888 RepID=A0A084JVA9_NONUL|nr:hypothetical protein IL45_12235 [Nonlabens ulvanivorans]
MQIKIITKKYKLLQRLQNAALLGMVICFLLFIFKEIEWKYSMFILMFAVSSFAFLAFVSLFIQILKLRFIKKRQIDMSIVQEVTWNVDTETTKSEVHLNDLTYTRNYITLDNNNFEIKAKSAFILGNNNLELVRLTHLKTSTFESNPKDLLSFFN